MERVLNFLSDLGANNDKIWFDANKNRYREAKSVFEDFACELIERVKSFDSSMNGLTLKDCTYRIYRDVRFSPDKRPYKTHMGVFIAKGGKKSGRSGYYFHIEPKGQAYLGGHLMCCGAYCPEPAVLKSIREEFMLSGDELVETIKTAQNKGFEVEWESCLQRVPKGFPADSPFSDYFRLKNMLVSQPVNDRFILGRNLAKRVADKFESCLDFNTRLNRAIDYAYEEMM